MFNTQHMRNVVTRFYNYVIQGSSQFYATQLNDR
jgi:hypothetical protein